MPGTDPIKTILVGVDGSPESKGAVEFASRLALPAGAKMLLVYCIAPLATMESISLRAYLSAEREFGDGVLRELHVRLASLGVPNETLLVDGNPAGRLADLAQERDVDLLVVGHSGRGRPPTPHRKRHEPAVGDDPQAAAHRAVSSKRNGARISGDELVRSRRQCTHGRVQHRRELRDQLKCGAARVQHHHARSSIPSEGHVRAPRVNLAAGP
jgi:nucleotide-binding universal stress UspA family protein